MSHSVTITRTTTSSSTSAVILNTGYLKTLPGVLKLAETILGAVLVGIVGYYYNHRYSGMYMGTPELFFLLITVACLIATTCLLLSCVCSLSTGSIIAKTSYEVIYHSVACILYLVASVVFIIEVNNYSRSRYAKYDAYLAAAIIGFVNTVLYFLSAFFAFRTYRLP